MYLLIVMLAAGELSLKVVDTREGHDNPLFVECVDRFEEWACLHNTLERRAVEAVRAVLEGIEAQKVGHEVIVRYSPENRLREPTADPMRWQGSL